MYLLSKIQYLELSFVIHYHSVWKLQMNREKKETNKWINSAIEICAMIYLNWGERFASIWGNIFVDKTTIEVSARSARVFVKSINNFSKWTRENLTRIYCRAESFQQQSTKMCESFKDRRWTTTPLTSVVDESRLARALCSSLSREYWFGKCA